MSTILLIRHGETFSNVGLPTSFPETISLTELGIKQAKCITEYLKSRFSPDLIVTSSYRRSKQTAAPAKEIFPSVPREEWPVEEFTYLSSMHSEHSTVDERRPLVEAYWRNCDPFYIDGPGSESFEQFIARTHQVMIYLKCMDKYHNIAMFSHEQFVCALLWLLPRDSINLCQETMQEFRRFQKAKSLPNGAIVRVEFGNSYESWRYETITSHLEKLEGLEESEKLLDFRLNSCPNLLLFRESPRPYTL